MRLKKLLVSGFKSFVDVTDIRLPSHLVGVVGPNGCGKSNVIDAVRWVMGETSARMLRGDSMADVIFNGSASRKPVGKASVELIFDNSDGRAPGNYGQFAEISIKRTLTRDGHSTYHINNLKTRRRDVLDLFRGTGLGPRSYSIIEQGMVSRIVEARPEELRVFVEEAAGTSRYKDRRRETETKIAHTRDNLDRVADVREELAKQLRRLKRQSASARRYKVLKQEEREVNGQLHALRLNALDAQLSQQQRDTSTSENNLQSTLAQLREKEAELESVRKTQAEVSERNAQIQQEYYQLTAKISNTEQKIEYQKETYERQSEELVSLNQEMKTRDGAIEKQKQKGLELDAQLRDGLPEFESVQTACDGAQAELDDSERVLQAWLGEMELFSEQSREPAQQEEIQKSRIKYLEASIEKMQARDATLKTNITALTGVLDSQDFSRLQLEVSEHDSMIASAEDRLQKTENAIAELAAELETRRGQLASVDNQLHEVISRHDSLAQIQRAEMGGDDSELKRWLEQSGHSDSVGLAGKITLAAGWEAAADRVIGEFLGAIRTSSLDSLDLGNSPDCDFSALEPGISDNGKRSLALSTLASKVESGADLVGGLLGGIYVAETIEQALESRAMLSGREIIVTPAGEIVGKGWCSIPSSARAQTGMLVREEEMTQLRVRRGELEVEREEIKRQVEDIKVFRDEKSQMLTAQRTELGNMRNQASTLHNRLGQEEAQDREARDQLDKLKLELQQLGTEISTSENEIQNAQALLKSAREQSGTLEEKRRSLVSRRDELVSQVEVRKQRLELARNQRHEHALARQRLESDIESTRDTLRRLLSEREQAEARIQRLRSNEDNPAEQIRGLESDLEKLLGSKLEVDRKFAASREESDSFDEKISNLNDARQACDERVNAAREELDSRKLARQETSVRRDTLLEGIREQGFVIEECVDGIPEDADAEVWQAKLEDIQRKIDRIGPVNLVAIEEFDEESERMEYLDKQHADLSEALDTLESVIRKIDRETRSRFKETFDRINAGFNEYFPKLFGGGKAELQLTSDDLLTAGITVMARPPGKRNSHIHLLSGGEKALTAVAILFALFELNPAPFCMLDEVDAPLDDANVDRYCETLRALAAKSQMIVITHNKITMEAMDLLVGVTMAEAGVSRLVSVDIDQAIEMAAQ